MRSNLQDNIHLFLPLWMEIHTYNLRCNSSVLSMETLVMGFATPKS